VNDAAGLKGEFEQRHAMTERTFQETHPTRERWNATIAGLVVAVLASSQALAQDEKATIVGAGVLTCSEFAQAYQQSPESTETYFFAWAQGYMTGLNASMLTQKNLRAWPLEKQKQHIRAFCDKRPLANIRDAATDLFTNLPSR
jgi:hypothetical protein